MHSCDSNNTEFTSYQALSGFTIGLSSTLVIVTFVNFGIIAVLVAIILVLVRAKKRILKSQSTAAANNVIYEEPDHNDRFVMFADNAAYNLTNFQDVQSTRD